MPLEEHTPGNAGDPPYEHGWESGGSFYFNEPSGEEFLFVKAHHPGPSAATIFTLPVGWRPTVKVEVGNIVVDVDGTVKPIAPAEDVEQGGILFPRAPAPEEPPPAESRWFDGELFPVGRTPDTIGREWERAPLASFKGEDCNHDHVVAPIDRRMGLPSTNRGMICLHCMDCESSWWEDVALVKGSPFVPKAHA